jgi:hypothetical protein
MAIALGYLQTRKQMRHTMMNPYSSFSDRPLRNLLQMLQDGVHTLLQLLFVALLVAGLGGFVFTAFKPGGWLQSVLQPIWNTYPSIAIGAVIALLVGSTWLKTAFERLPMFGKRADWLVFGFLAFGVFVFGKLLLSGSE